MTWHKIDSGLTPRGGRKERRSRPCISRSDRRPETAYMMLPYGMATHQSACIYHDGGHRIAIEFRVDGDFAVRRTSGTSFTSRINLPTKLASLLPFGLHDVDLTEDPEGLLVLDLGVFRPAV